MKKILPCVISLLFLFELKSQDLYIKSEVQMVGIESGMDIPKSTIITHCTNGKVLSVISFLGRKDFLKLTEPGKVTMIQPDACGVFSKEELNEEKFEDEEIYSDVLVSFSDEQRKILGYQCKKAIINFTLTKDGNSSENFTFIWYTNQLKPISNDLPSVNKKNDYTDALQHIGGIVLYTETGMKSNTMRTINSVTEISTNKIDEKVFSVADRMCKKPKSLAEFKSRKKKGDPHAMIGYSNVTFN
jgi:hypothetical protein